VASTDWSNWPVLEVRVRAPHPTCYARVVMDALRAGLQRGVPFVVVVIGEPTAPPRPSPVLGPIDTRWLRHCRGVLARNCRGIAYVTDCEPARLPGCPAKACPDVEAARSWARERLADAPRVPAGVS
jgi:hypothetical protein